MTQLYKSLYQDSYNKFSALLINSNEEIIQKDIFIKFSPLIDPIKYVSDKYDLSKNLMSLPILENNNQYLDKIYDLNNRDNMNFREINVGYNAQEVKDNERGQSADALDLGNEFSEFGEDALKKLEKELGVDCIGEDCCDHPNTIWNKKYGTCF